MSQYSRTDHCVLFPGNYLYRLRGNFFVSDQTILLRSRLRSIFLISSWIFLFYIIRFTENDTGTALGKLYK